VHATHHLAIRSRVFYLARVKVSQRLCSSTSETTLVQRFKHNVYKAAGAAHEFKELGIAVVALIGGAVTLTSYIMHLSSRMKEQDVIIASLNKRIDDARQAADKRIDDARQAADKRIDDARQAAVCAFLLLAKQWLIHF